MDGIILLLILFAFWVVCNHFLRFTIEKDCGSFATYLGRYIAGFILSRGTQPTGMPCLSGGAAPVMRCVAYIYNCSLIDFTCQVYRLNL